MKQVVELKNIDNSIVRFLSVDDAWVSPTNKYGILFATKILTVVVESPPAYDSLTEKLVAAIRIEGYNYIKYFIKQNLTQEEIDLAASFLKESQSRTLLQDRKAIEALWFMLRMERKQRLGGVLTENEQTKYNQIANIFGQIENL